MNIRFGTSGLGGMLQNVIKGKYYDITPMWLEAVGPVILLTMVINIFSTPAFVLLFHLLRLCSRGKDQGTYLKIITIFF